MGVALDRRPPSRCASYGECRLQSLPFPLTLNGEGYPFVALLVFLIAVLYQLVSGTLLKFWGASTTRKSRPRVYWTVFAIELMLVLLGLYLGTL
jgi:hypothetical protein